MVVLFGTGWAERVRFSGFALLVPDAEISPPATMRPPCQKMPARVENAKKLVPLMNQARAMVRAGEIGKVRLVVTNFSHGHHGDAGDADNPREAAEAIQATIAAQF